MRASEYIYIYVQGGKKTKLTGLGGGLPRRRHYNAVENNLKARHLSAHFIEAENTIERSYFTMKSFMLNAFFREFFKY